MSFYPGAPLLAAHLPELPERAGRVTNPRLEYILICTGGKNRVVDHCNRNTKETRSRYTLSCCWARRSRDLNPSLGSLRLWIRQTFAGAEELSRIFVNGGRRTKGRRKRKGRGCADRSVRQRPRNRRGRGSARRIESISAAVATA